jgi:hypothetical protein
MGTRVCPQGESDGGRVGENGYQIIEGFGTFGDLPIELDLNKYFLGDLAKLFGILQHCVGH